MTQSPLYSTVEIEEALAACAREPVHIPGAIQPVGALISLDGKLQQVRQVSANLADVLGVTVADALASTSTELLGKRLIAALRRELTHQERLPSALNVRRRVGGHQRRLHVVAYRSGSRVVVELEPLAHRDERRLLAVVNEWLLEVGAIDDSETLLEALTRRVRHLTGHDRVMVYRFDEHWNGQVVAEARSEQAGSFLGHHFPASDIPAQVRHLYDINRVRSIPNATSDSIPLVPLQDPKDPEPLDLSRGGLRAVSPIHLEYLQHMGVAASLSVAMHDERRLWGLLACHGLTPVDLPAAVRDTVRALVQIAMPRMMLLNTRAESRLLQSIHDSRELLVGERGRLEEPAAMLRGHAQQWLDLLRAAGVALVRDGRVSGVGRLPHDDSLVCMAAWLDEAASFGGTWNTTALQETPLGRYQVDDLCGMLAASLPGDDASRGWLMLFRPERREIRRWAGKPEDVPMLRDGRLVLTPRRSFAQWQDEFGGHSLPWTVIERRAASDLAEDFAVLVSGHEIAQLNQRLDRANRKLKTLAYNDGLTGTWNRYRMEQALDAALNAADRHGQPFAVLLFDVDHFKDFNDTHGHEAGDRVLIALTETILAHLRETDTLGRWGGEEFLVLADHCDHDGAMMLGERLRQAAAGVSLEGLEPVTISIGVAAWRQGDTRKALVAHADRAMYAAKQAGRNRVVEETREP
ncbi:sensor domain-containing diguanylate cyclase [Halomonas urumqiensis]|uniref:diguanylate cyclase n=1 Tax=Halomonas urumqiensis TaxID=1684789 RepID=A0A2N7UNJ5_9GAMM|nr:sensor domain-containing diguanylate cyclase [Halomonas urumqiensis]PMR82023.1 hypothetical protein C1H70_02135 [Halomonas urumqiensis]PTB02645.1 hypothetical protein C6V82_08330 [Halomonas urumqiensis]GHE21130.1 hypothetical protein GCM10017767_16510 [Halomonas urumqiensis]